MLRNTDLQPASTKRSLRTLAKASATLLVLGSVFAPLNTMAATHQKLSLHSAHIAVNSQVLTNPGGILNKTDPKTNKKIAFMPVWYAFYLLKPYGLSYQWDANTDSLYIQTSTAKSNQAPPTAVQKDGNLKVYLNGRHVQTMAQYVRTDPASGVKSLYVPVWYMDQALAHIDVAGSWNGNKQIWNLSLGGQAKTASEMVSTISEAIANSPFLIKVNPATLAGSPLGPGHKVVVKGSDGKTVQAVWNSHALAYEAVFTAAKNANLSFTTTVDGSPLPGKAKTDVQPQGGPANAAKSVIEATQNADGTVTVLIVPKDADGNPVGAGLAFTITASNGQTETAIWNAAIQGYQVTFQKSGTGIPDTSPLTFNIAINQTIFVKNVPVQNPASNTTTDSPTNSSPTSNTASVSSNHGGSSNALNSPLLSTSNTTSTSSTLTWNAVNRATSYNVYEGSTQIATEVTGTSYTVNGLAPNFPYTFTVTAVASGGESGPSNAVAVSTLPLAPTTPSSLTASAAGASSLTATATATTLAWRAVPGATSYNIYENGGSTPIATGISGTSYQVTGLTPGTPYTFTVSAVNAGGESAQSPALSVQTAKPGSIQMNLSQTDVLSGGSDTVTGTVYDVNNDVVPDISVTLSGVTGNWESPSGPSSTSVTSDVYGAFTSTWFAPDILTSTQATVTASVYSSVYDTTPTTMDVALAPPLSIGSSPAQYVTKSNDYSQFIAVAGGFAPYTFSVSTGALPAGMSLGPNTGVISGSPTATGTSTFTVNVTDADGNAAQQPFTIMVEPAAASLSTTPTAKIGTDIGTTVLILKPNNPDDTFEEVCASAPLATPWLGQSAAALDPKPSPYIPGTNLSMNPGHYVGVYEVDSSGNVAAFSQLQIGVPDINNGASVR